MKILMVFAVLFVSSCSADVPEVKKVRTFLDLRVENLSEQKIYPALLSGEGKHKEFFGVVSVGSSKTVGFGAFKLSDSVIVAWEEGSDEKDIIVEIDVTPIMPINENTRRVSFVYTGNKTWHVECLDKDRNVVSRSDVGRLVLDYNGPEIVDLTPFVDAE